MKTLSILLLCICALSARAGKYVTISKPGAGQLFLLTNEVAKIVSFAHNGVLLDVRFGDVGVTLSHTNLPFTVVGPAYIYLSELGPQKSGICTIEIEPNMVAPANTGVIPQGTSASISLEASPDLSTWTNIVTATYSNAPTHMFFRMRLDRQ